MRSRNISDLWCVFLQIATYRPNGFLNHLKSFEIFCSPGFMANKISHLFVRLFTNPKLPLLYDKKFQNLWEKKPLCKCKKRLFLLSRYFLSFYAFSTLWDDILFLDGVTRSADINKYSAFYKLEHSRVICAIHVIQAARK